MDYPREASREARDAFVELLTVAAEEHATGSRDFGRGFSHAIRTLHALDVECEHCPLDSSLAVGEDFSCPHCPAVWRRESFTSWRRARTKK
jgi:hypothetical protein